MTLGFNNRGWNVKDSFNAPDHSTCVFCLPVVFYNNKRMLFPLQKKLKHEYIAKCLEETIVIICSLFIHAVFQRTGKGLLNFKRVI